MSSPAESRADDLRVLMRREFDAGKRWWAYALAAQAALVIVAAAAARTAAAGTAFDVLMLLAFGATALVQWQADGRLARGNDALVALDRRDLLGRNPSPTDIANLAVATDIDLRTVPATDECYWASVAGGIEGSISRLTESAWWSQHVAARAFSSFAVVLAIVLVCTLVVLASGASLVDPASRGDAVSVALSVATLLISGAFIKTTWAYHQFSTCCALVVERLRPGVGEADFTQILADYQLARMAAPPLPDWIWRRNRDRLNYLWSREASKSPFPSPRT